MSTTYRTLVCAAAAGLVAGCRPAPVPEPPEGPAPEIDTRAIEASRPPPDPEPPGSGEALPEPPPARPSDCCRGFNECKGKGSCATDAHACAGKNECKGLGGCKPPSCT